ncbi:hypothetical protein BMG00_11025 [Thioclava marina]|uniref:Uncharacterized protein n=1 Tax=Thioclava marina TaxID=1915077 RepID=A0ABX3MKC5_9RHOB|nr:hypothetical protein BMG00_11025 [Thioclava marina]
MIAAIVEHLAWVQRWGRIGASHVGRRDPGPSDTVSTLPDLPGIGRCVIRLRYLECLQGKYVGG